MGLTGLLLVGFVVAHLLGNLLLLFPEGEPFNAYAHKLESLGGLIIVAEIGLTVLFGVHILSAMGLLFDSRKARPIKYAVVNSKGGPTKNTWASRNMAITGSILLFFVVLHIFHFAKGPGIEEGYVTTLHGENIRDLHRLVVESFHNPVVVTFYCLVMAFMGMHLRHGFWSAFQSLGAANKRLTGPLYALAWGLALVLTLGFFILPLWIYFDVGARFR